MKDDHPYPQTSLQGPTERFLPASPSNLSLNARGPPVTQLLKTVRAKKRLFKNQFHYSEE